MISARPNSDTNEFIPALFEFVSDLAKLGISVTEFMVFFSRANNNIDSVNNVFPFVCHTMMGHSTMAVMSQLIRKNNKKASVKSLYLLLSLMLEIVEYSDVNDKIKGFLYSAAMLVVALINMLETVYSAYNSPADKKNACDRGSIRFEIVFVSLSMFSMAVYSLVESLEDNGIFESKREDLSSGAADALTATSYLAVGAAGVHAGFRTFDLFRKYFSKVCCCAEDAEEEPLLPSRSSRKKKNTPREEKYRQLNESGETAELSFTPTPQNKRGGGGYLS